MTEKDSTSRRTFVKAAVTGTATATAGVGLLTLESKPAVAASGLSASDVDVTSNDGDLTSLTIAPDITVGWSGQESPIAEVQYVWSASTSTNSGSLGTFSKSISTPTKSDSGVSKTFDTINMLGKNGGPLDASNFDAASDGGTKTTDVTITMDVTLKDSNGNTVHTKNSALSSTYAVNVTNKTSTVSSSGTANTGGS